MTETYDRISRGERDALRSARTNLIEQRIDLARRLRETATTLESIDRQPSDINQSESWLSSITFKVGRER